MSAGWSSSYSHFSLAHHYSGFTWITFTFVLLCVSLSSICWVSSLAIIKMTEELKVTFFFGLSPAFWDVTIGRLGLSLPVAGVSFMVLWYLIRRKQRSCKRHCRNCQRGEEESYNFPRIHITYNPVKRALQQITGNNPCLHIYTFF